MMKGGQVKRLHTNVLELKAVSGLETVQGSVSINQC